MKVCVVGLGGNSLFFGVDHFHKEGETVSSHSFFSEPGGKGYNQAVAAARLGAETSFIGAFGRDVNSHQCIEFLKNEGIIPLVAYKDVPCACACILTDKDGENRVTVYGGAAALLDENDIEKFEDNIASSDILILQNEVPTSANKKAFEIAKAHGVYIIFNPAPAVDVDRALLLNADIITPNLHEAQTLFGEDYKKGMAEKGVNRAVVTLGSNGAELLENGEWKHIAPYKVKAVDTTGGGDCFNGALAVGMKLYEGLYEACDFAALAASVAVSRPHAVEAMPYISDIFSKKQ